MKDATITTLYKNKGDRGDCNNYRGISLLSITGKLFVRVIIKRLQIIGEKNISRVSVWISHMQIDDDFLTSQATIAVQKTTATIYRFCQPD
jgi:hypothetical protein